MADPISVEVAFALPATQRLIALEVPVGTTAREAVEKSGIVNEFPQIDIAAAALGVFSRRVGADYTLQAGDRVEIYRPLIADPKETRRQRAEAQKKG
jgi:putative ubiquitin-RnfH superfamily antitoxin RatB of RatAB toxin-antitoxin module